MCYNKCAFGSADCTRGDAVFYPDVATGKFIGTAFRISGKTVYVMGPKHGSYTWEEAKVAGSNYSPTGLESDSKVGKGKWHLLSYADDSGNYIHYYFYVVHANVFLKEGSSWGFSFWSDREKDSEYAYYRWAWGWELLRKTTKYPIVPVITYQKP